MSDTNKEETRGSCPEYSKLFRPGYRPNSIACPLMYQCTASKKYIEWLKELKSYDNPSTDKLSEVLADVAIEEQNGSIIFQDRVYEDDLERLDYHCKISEKTHRAGHENISCPLLDFIADLKRVSVI